MAASDDKVKALLQQAEDGVKAVFESDNYKNYLVTMSKFHNYSFRNSLLILINRPDASHVAGYSAWQTKFKRHVNKGEKGIPIVGYTPRKVTVEQNKTDSAGNTVYKADGTPEKEKVTKQLPAFKIVYVYDVAQTDGEPLPQLVNELSDRVNGFDDLLTVLKEVAPLPVEFIEIGGDTKGFYEPDKRLAIKDGMSQAQTIKTLIHEITHSSLHTPEMLKAAAEQQPDRRTKEVQAESVAFVVCNHYGIDTSDYSFPYLASWSSGKELKELQSSLEVIQQQANELISSIDTRLEELQKERDVSIELPAPDKAISDYLQEEDSYFHADTLAEKYDTLIGNDEKARMYYPFHIEDQAERLKAIQGYIEKYDANRLNEAVRDKISRDTPEEAAINQAEFDKVQSGCDIYENNSLKEQFELSGGSPLVFVRFSEHPDVPTEKIMTLHEANTLFNRLDNAVRAEREDPESGFYYKTDFKLLYQKDGFINSYDGRQDLGDGDGTITEHIKLVWQGELLPDMKALHINSGNTQIIEHAEHVLSEFAPYLETHDALSGLEKQVEIVLKEHQAAKETGSEHQDTDKVISYYTEVNAYINEARRFLNENMDLPSFPNRQDFGLTMDGSIADDLKLLYETYETKVREEVAAEAKLAGITVPQYLEAGSIAPADRNYAIYQMKDEDSTRDIHFSSFDELTAKGIVPAVGMYDKVYEGVLPQGKDLNDIFTEFNINRPADFKGHSLSMGDIVTVGYKGELTANYVDRYSFVNVPSFVAELQQDNSREEQRRANETLDSIKFDGDIDLDKEKTREQLGFSDAPPAAQLSIKDKIALASAEADRRNQQKGSKEPALSNNREV